MSGLDSSSYEAVDPAAIIRSAVLEHRNELVAFVERILPAELRATFDPHDIVQDVTFDALRRAGQFVDIDKTSRRRWLTTIARNRILYLLRRHKASRQAAQITDDDSLVSLLAEIATYERTPSASAASRETHDAVSASLARLSPAHAQTIRWRIFDGLTHAQIAQRTGQTENAARQLYHYALAALRRELSVV